LPDGITAIAETLVQVYETGFTEPREDMALGSLCGGIALSNAKLGAVHGFAGPIGGMFDAPHGAICARLLPFVMETNIQAMQVREPKNPALQRYWMVANRLEYLAGDWKLADGPAWVHRVCEKLHIPPLSTWGITSADIPAIVEKSAVASSMQGNPIKLTTDEMTTILQRAL
jgi:alcohol dehydrogenase class IV